MKWPPIGSIDKRRMRRVFGDIARDEIAAIDEGLAVFLGLGGRLHVRAHLKSGTVQAVRAQASAPVHEDAKHFRFRGLTLLVYPIGGTLS
jgi:hypothetical protein